MSSPWNRGSGRGGRRPVPYETAKKLAEQRDRLAEEVRELRGRIETLEDRLDARRSAQEETEEEREELRERARSAEERTRELEEQLEELSVDEGESEAGTILEVARKGVVLEDGTVIIPAKVRVAR